MLALLPRILLHLCLCLSILNATVACGCAIFRSANVLNVQRCFSIVTASNTYCMRSWEQERRRTVALSCPSSQLSCDLQRCQTCKDRTFSFKLRLLNRTRMLCNCNFTCKCPRLVFSFLHRFFTLSELCVFCVCKHTWTLSKFLLILKNGVWRHSFMTAMCTTRSSFR